MSDQIVSYTTIRHTFRKENGLTCNEYVVADIINFICSARKYSKDSWSDIDREKMAEEIGISRRSLFNIISKLSSLGFVEIQAKTNRVRTTEKWQEVYFSHGKKVPTKEESHGKKVPTPWEESSQELKHTPYIVRIKGIYTHFLTKDEVFEKIYSLYDKKVDRSSSRKKFEKINPKDYQKIFDSIPEYVKSTPDPQYRKNLTTWINNKCWNDIDVPEGIFKEVKEEYSQW